MKTAGVRELKTHFSAYLRDVEHGEVVLVTDRGRVVAEIRPPGAADRCASPEDLRHSQMVAEGRLRPASSSKREWSSWPDPCLSPGAANELIDAERGE